MSPDTSGQSQKKIPKLDSKIVRNLWADTTTATTSQNTTYTTSITSSGTAGTQMPSYSYDPYYGNQTYDAYQRAYPKAYPNNRYDRPYIEVNGHGDARIEVGGQRLELDASIVTEIVQRSPQFRNELDRMMRISYPPPRVSAKPSTGFNQYVNASDLMEEFIKFAGEQGAKQGDIMGLPVELFIKWLILEACEKDQQPPPPDVVLALPPGPAPVPQPRCLSCQRFMKRGVHLPVHEGRCATRALAKQRELVNA